MMHRFLHLLVLFLVHLASIEVSNAFTQPISWTPKGENNPKVVTSFRGGSSSTPLNVVAPAVAAITLPSVKTIALVNILPTCIGFYKYEYGVSYAYGTATATTAFLVLQALLGSNANIFTAVAKLHAVAIMFYGIRLNLFLFYREFLNERFRSLRERIEERQNKKEGDRGLIGKLLNRTPFILSCSMLYAGLAAPALSSAKLIQMGALPSCHIASTVFKVLVGFTWFGFILGAVGDLQKTLMKSLKGPDHLVTGGVYSFFRHPNYTGEVIGWSASFMASVVAIMGTICSGSNLDVLKALSPLLALSSVGVIGILFVLFSAATNLENRQKEKYGDSKEYNEWIKTSWSGPVLKSKK